MFTYIVFVLLALLLFLATGAAIYIGIFKANRARTGTARKLVSGLVSYAIAGVFWYAVYGYHYLGW